jgi:nicotinate-nucleotide pyrophosphorylase (carboxylating)
MVVLPAAEIRRAVRQGIEEDLGRGDVTTAALFPSPVAARARVIAQQPLVVAGMAAAVQTFVALDAALRVSVLHKDGAHAKPGDTLMGIEGDGRSILMGERLALNFLQSLSGIATLTDRFCRAVRGHRAIIMDTRKTLPGWRALQKWAVALGGGTNHRRSLGDGIMIKDNHLALLDGRQPVLRACLAARAGRTEETTVIVEAESLAEVKQALAGQAEIILLDNMTPRQVKQAVRLIKGRTLVEVSGGITLKNARAMAAAGADRISIGSLTHSAPAATMTLELEPLSRTQHKRV